MTTHSLLVHRNHKIILLLPTTWFFNTFLSFSHAHTHFLPYSYFSELALNSEEWHEVRWWVAFFYGFDIVDNIHLCMVWFHFFYNFFRRTFMVVDHATPFFFSHHKMNPPMLLHYKNSSELFLFLFSLNLNFRHVCHPIQLFCNYQPFRCTKKKVY